MRGVELGVRNTSGRRRVNDPAHGTEGETSMRHERTACACGCGGEARKPARYIRGHHTRLKRDYEVNDAGCWVWLGAKNLKGYGLVQRDGRGLSAHRWYYERRFGAVPDGLELDHLCRNESCVNPDHLEAVTAATNSQRRRSSKLTWNDVRAIRASGFGCAEVARRWGICESNASMVLRGETWKEAA